MTIWAAWLPSHSPGVGSGVLPGVSHAQSGTVRAAWQTWTAPLMASPEAKPRPATSVGRVKWVGSRTMIHAMPQIRRRPGSFIPSGVLKLLAGCPGGWAGAKDGGLGAPASLPAWGHLESPVEHLMDQRPARRPALPGPPSTALRPSAHGRACSAMACLITVRCNL